MGFPIWQGKLIYLYPYMVVKPTLSVDYLPTKRGPS